MAENVEWEYTNCCPECADEARSRSLHAFEEKRKQDARKAAEEACGMAKTGDRESALEW